MPGRSGLIALAVAASLAFCVSAPASALAQADLEYAVKANYLVRFAAFVDWPPQAFASPEAPLVICIAGRDPFGTVLTRAAVGQTAYGRSLRVVTRVTETTAAGCHILYLGDAADRVLTAGRPVLGRLTVSDAAVSPRTGIVHFVLQSSRVRFHIDDAAARRGGLSVNSRLLALALTVKAT